MSDYGHIGDAMVFLAVMASFCLPALFGAIVGVVLAFLGAPPIWYLGAAGLGVVSGGVSAGWVLSQR